MQAASLQRWLIELESTKEMSMSKKPESDPSGKASTIRQLRAEEAEVVGGAATGEILSRYFKVRLNDETGKEDTGGGQ